VDDPNQAQLAAIAELAELLGGARIEYWLMGGWAVDFHAGAATREHTDVDFAIWVDDVPRITELLKGAGWRHAPDKGEDGGTGYERQGVRFEVTYLARDENAGVYTPLRDRREPWQFEAFGDDVRELLGARCRVVALGSLMRSKSSPRDDPAEAARDRADYRVLRQLAP
jgi:aminoglycoside-2''-adenylyltransferase